MNKTESVNRPPLQKLKVNTKRAQKKVLSRNFSLPNSIIGIEYKGEISLDQIIACKKRERKFISRSALTSNKQTLSMPSGTIAVLKAFTEDFYDDIEAFLDLQGMFIVSPTPIRNPKNYLKSLKTQSQSDLSELLKHIVPIGGEEEYKDPDLDTKEKEHETPTLSKNKCEPTGNEKEFQKSGPFLGKVSTSSLLLKRKKFSTVDCMISIKGYKSDI